MFISIALNYYLWLMGDGIIHWANFVAFCVCVSWWWMNQWFADNRRINRE